VSPYGAKASNVTPLFVVAGLQAEFLNPKKIDLQFDDFASKSLGNWIVVHLLEERPFLSKGKYFTVGALHSSASRAVGKYLSIQQLGQKGIDLQLGRPTFPVTTVPLATDVAVSWLGFFILDFTW
jgi:hypothetical protein